MAPLFSVIIPVFNGGAYLDRTIASVLGQTFSDFELILVDDGSTDGAVDRARSIQDARLSILAQPNTGAPSALNRGIAAARGEYIAFLDSDDLWTPDKLERHRESFVAHPEADLTFSGLIYIGPDDRSLGLPERRPTGSFTFEQLFVDNVIGSSSVIAARKQAVKAAGSFDPAMLYLFDIDLVLRMSRLRPWNVLGIPEPLTLYRRRPGQQTSDWRIIAKYWSKVVDKHRTLEPKIKPLERAAQMNLTRYLSYLAFEQGDPSTAWSLLCRAFEMNPFRFTVDLRNWKLGSACAAASFLPGPFYCWLATQVGLAHTVQRTVQRTPAS
ncbi:MAG: glycosyltransferase [Acidobacteriaceae bacterium]|nr:glycosyltransferase [Acidobacteriaceae bacterium]